MLSPHFSIGQNLLKEILRKDKYCKATFRKVLRQVLVNVMNIHTQTFRDSLHFALKFVKNFETIWSWKIRSFRFISKLRFLKRNLTRLLLDFLNNFPKRFYWNYTVSSFKTNSIFNFSIGLLRKSWEFKLNIAKTLLYFLPKKYPQKQEFSQIQVWVASLFSFQFEELLRSCLVLGQIWASAFRNLFAYKKRVLEYFLT